jgi:transcriptional regulator with XRE-family HTH domain
MHTEDRGTPTTDLRVQEWYARNPLRRWRIRGRREAREVEDELKLSRGHVYSWETGLTLPDRRTLRTLARVTGMSDLAASWSHWRDLKPPLRDVMQKDGAAHADVPSTSGPPRLGVASPSGVQPSRACRQIALDRIRTEITDWSGPDSPLRALCSWDALPSIVDDEIRRHDAFGLGFSLVLFEVKARPVATEGDVWQTCLQHIAGLIGRTLRTADCFFHDDTGRFVALLSRTSDTQAHDYAARVELALARDPLGVAACEIDRFSLRNVIASYPQDGATRDALLGRLDPSIAAAVGKIDAYGARSM